MVIYHIVAVVDGVFDGKDRWAWFKIPCQNNNLELILDIYIYHKNEKANPRKKDLPLLKNDITNIFDLWYLRFYSSDR